MEYFVQRLRSLERPVVLVFFGDHQPGIVQSYEETVNDEVFDEVHLENLYRLYQTQYVVWANYSVTGSEMLSDGVRFEDASAECLAAMVMEVIGAPLTDFQKARLALRKNLVSVSGAVHKDGDGNLHLNGLGETNEYDSLALLTYYHFGSYV